MESTTIWEKMFLPIFGPNWKTYLSAFVAFIFFASAFLLTPANQTMFMALNIPDTMKTWIIDGCKFIAFLSTMLFAYHTASNTGLIGGHGGFYGASEGDKTGERHTTKATMLGSHRSAPKDNPMVPIVQWLILLGVIFLCAVISFRLLF